MASNVLFSDSMNSQQLCAYLKAQGMAEADVKLIAGKDELHFANCVKIIISRWELHWKEHLIA